jgi:hypothetical protein
MPRPIRIKVQRTPKPAHDVPEPPVPVITQELLAKVAKSYIEHDNRVTYEQAKARAEDPGIDPKVLALAAVNGPFRRFLAKYKGFDPLELMEATIAYIRQERPVTVPAEPEPETPKKPRYTDRQLLQQKRTLPPLPMVNPSVTRPKGGVRVVPVRRACDDEQIVEAALRELFVAHPDLKKEFCEATLVEAKQLLRGTGIVVRLQLKLVEGFEENGQLVCLAYPKRAINYFDTAAGVLKPEYAKQAQQAEESARQAKLLKARGRGESGAKAPVAVLQATNTKDPFDPTKLKAKSLSDMQRREAERSGLLAG